MKSVFEGKVISGRKKGQKLGFPTINIELNGEIEEGVYAGWAIIKEKKYQAGIVHQAGTNIIEAHILDFQEIVYEKIVKLEIGEKIREIINFKNDNELVTQIKKDIEVITRKLRKV